MEPRNRLGAVSQRKSSNKLGLWFVIVLVHFADPGFLLLNLPNNENG